MAKKHLEDLLTDVSFVRWIRGEASPNEKLKWDRWLQEDPEHQQLADEAREVITAFQEEIYEIPVVSQEWQKLEELIDEEERKVRVHEKRGSRYPFWKSNYMVTALLIISIVLGVFAVYQYQSTDNTQSEVASEKPSVQEYRTDYGEKVTFRLSDDSRIVLNANSRIQFSSDANGGVSSTDVWLQGEAWFDITHHEGENERTFTVHTDDGAVQVLGTRFAVKTFKNETRAVLEEGEIQVQLPGDGTILKNSATMLPGEMALFSASKDGITLEKVNPRIYTSWREDVWFFENTMLDEIGRRIEDTFGIEVVIQEELTERKLSGSIKGTNLDVLAEALKKILNVDIERKNQAIYIGTIEINQQ
ncbi:MAG: FecR domain-containing protein [Balneolaceae bacterium]|nr:FecR domain-containing protein [Balneolaceae bacterium]